MCGREAVWELLGQGSEKECVCLDEKVLQLIYRSLLAG